MTEDSTFAQKLKNGDFVVTAEFLPHCTAQPIVDKDVISALKDGPVAVNVADNPDGPVMSSVAASVALSQANIEPIYQLVTRDRNRIALQSDLLGAASLGISNVLCLSGYHQALTKSREAGNAYDIDSIQLVAAIKAMNEEGVLLEGTKIEGPFSMFVGAAANPALKPLELNMLRVVKKVEAGAQFIQTQAVFDTEDFQEWLDTVREEGITAKASILAGVLPLKTAAKAENLRDTFTDFFIPDEVIERLKGAGDERAQKEEGLVICKEIMERLKAMEGLGGIHILSGGNESVVPELMASIRE